MATIDNFYNVNNAKQDILLAMVNVFQLAYKIMDFRWLVKIVHSALIRIAWIAQMTQQLV